MGNFKIKVNSEAESREVQELFFELGLRFVNVDDFEYPQWLAVTNPDGTFSNYSISKNIWYTCNPKETTLPELRAMVSPMKEYLDKQEDGTYKLITASSSCADRDWIEVPEGAEILTEVANGLFFYKKQGDRFAYCFAGEIEWRNTLINPYDDPRAFVCGFLWQRTPPLNDQYAEIEQVRQHRHYFIDVSDVDEIDFYEIALRYNVTDPCIQHILKKCLAVGQRGQKDFHHDLKDIYDTAKRMLDVHGLDS